MPRVPIDLRRRLHAAEQRAASPSTSDRSAIVSEVEALMTSSEPLNVDRTTAAYATIKAEIDYLFREPSEDRHALTKTAF